MDDDLSFALFLADRADTITMSRFRHADLDVRTKPDRSAVTEADLATERALRSLIAEHRPGDGIVGEEFDETPGEGRRWILDPVDHTDNYTRGIEVFATLIALEEQGRITVGVVSAPAMGRRWWASRGQGAHTSGPPWNGADGAQSARRMRVSDVDDLADVHLSYAALDHWERRGLVPGLIQLSKAARYEFASACFWGQMLVAEGRCDVSLNPRAKIWDNAPIQVIVEEAGGRFSDLAGEPRIDRNCAVVTNGLLHDEVLALLSRPPDETLGEGDGRSAV
ncbi:histidinol phosphatase [Actinoallomurus purpureus]|uniref:inositol monophosphatase family protein n=1 Tax=Actinoallomurus purpureus TaxID=478114 RepID=UPI002093F741|nr:inositol monophosphatase family protein [Actinoallomurus purpureus]MCO6007426.1 histidinol phosphatase [Actinoallomurus purpureus]